jgi:hypothetical protein
MSCPKCNSDEWKLASLVHTEGKSYSFSHSSASGIGIGTGGLGIGIGGANTSGINQTQLSAIAAPPTRADIQFYILGGGAILVFPIVFILMLIFNFSAGPAATLWWFLVPIALIGYGLSIREQAIEDYDNNLKKWNDTRMCLRCGKFYLPD